MKTLATAGLGWYDGICNEVVSAVVRGFFGFFIAACARFLLAPSAETRGGTVTGGLLSASTP